MRHIDLVRSMLRRACSVSIPETARKNRQVVLEALDRRTLLAGDVFFTVLHDLNANGVKDAEEPPLQGWTVWVETVNRNGIIDPGEPSAVTGPDGEVQISGIAEGTWDMREQLPPGWTPAPGHDSLIRDRIRNGETYDATFLNVPSANGDIDGTVWSDMNGDGVRDPSDIGIPGWTVFLDANNDGILNGSETSTTTDTSGYFLFSNLPAGSYRVVEVIPAGWETTIGYDSRRTVTVTPATTQTVDFGNYGAGTVGGIKGRVVNDVNADGVLSATEPGLDAWTVFIDSDGNDLLDPGELSTTTDAGGNYSFPSLFAGTYKVTEIVEPGWNVSPGMSSSYLTTVVAESIATQNFGNWTLTLGSVSGTVWNDANGDGFQTGEAGLSGWTVYVDLNGNASPDVGEPSASTDANGDYLIASVSLGTASVREVVQSTWTPTAPGTGVQTVTVTNGATLAGIDFGNKQRTDSAIRGVAFADYNLNGTRETGERGLAGLTVYLDLNNNNSLDSGEPSMVTLADLFYTPAINEAGTYEFTHLAAGTYKVREIIPATLSATLESVRSQTVTLTTGQERNDVNFANRFRANEIHGHKYNDLNGNGQRDAGEPGVAGVTIYLDLDRDNVLDSAEPRTTTAPDGSYAFITDLVPGTYVVREIVPWGWNQTSPHTTTGGTLWPAGVSNAAIGNVSPTSITTVLANGDTHTTNVSLTLPNTGSITNMVDVFLLFDDTGSFTGNSPIIQSAFPQIIATLQAAMPGVNFGFGVGRLEEYANFASEYATGRPFILNQPIISQDTPGFSASIQSALSRTTPGYGGDEPETDIEALFQVATGRGFDGNNNGTYSDSGAAGLESTQRFPGTSGDVPAFSSFTIDPAGNVLPASGNVGGAGFRPGALPIILTATDTGFAFQPKGETSITGVNGTSLSVGALTGTSRNTTPFGSGAGIQETITALNALGALVIGLGTNPLATADPRQGLEALARLTGAVNTTTTTIANGTADPIAPGDPFYFQIASGFGASVANGITSAISNAVANVDVNITLKASDPRVHVSWTPGTQFNVGAGETAAFTVTFTGDGAPRRFDLQFIREGTDVVLGSIPVVIGTPIAGEDYHFDELEDGEIDDTVDFGNIVDPAAVLGVVSSFENQTRQALVIDFDHDVASSLSVDDLVVTNVDTSATIALQNFTYDAGTHQATAQFNPLVLGSGHYRLSIAAGSLTGLLATHTLDFTVTQGDATGDGLVNFDDLLILAQNYGLSGKTRSQGNLDYSADGIVGFDDLLILAQHYQVPAALMSRLAAPPATKKPTRRASAASVIV